MIPLFLSFLMLIFTNIHQISQNKYIGQKLCGICHKKFIVGEQHRIWKESAHSRAYQTLLTDKANNIAGGKATENKKCLKCHTTGYGNDPKLFGRKFKIEDGVQCESCHGAGSEYKHRKIMKDHKKAVAAGLIDYKNEKEVEKMCKTCHNDESPTFNGFDFKKMWEKIKHPVPQNN